MTGRSEKKNRVAWPSKAHLYRDMLKQYPIHGSHMYVLSSQHRKAGKNFNEFQNVKTYVGTLKNKIILCLTEE